MSNETMNTAVAPVPDELVSGADVDLAKLEAFVQQLDADYGPMLEQPITDKKGLEKVKRARLDILQANKQGVISRLELGRKEYHEKWQMHVKAIGKVEALFDPLVEKFRAHEKAFEDIEKNRMLEQAAAWARKVQERKEALFEAGFSFNGTAYVLDNEKGGEYAMTEEEVTGPGFKDVEFGQWLQTAQDEVKVLRDIKAEEEAKKQEAAERVQKEAAALEQRRLDLEARERAMNERVNEGRKNELLALGSTLGERGVMVSIPLYTDAYLVESLYTFTDEQWGRILVLFTNAKEAAHQDWLKAEAELQQQRKKEAQERAAKDEQIRKEASERAVAEERARVEREAAEAEQHRLANLKAEQDRIAALDDKEKAKLYLDYLGVIMLPQLTSNDGKRLRTTISDHLQKMMFFVNEFIQ